ncbi:hypothetical protein COT99_03665 [Candidatus Falkowbacteria bacterium CG10_big_fil_rev_8_21_14_0_10_43_10]|uniref:UPF0235 protein COT99_03665 n=1 Tax=Candidatus Falkowbacteria bacterium CG10_big_fil_rev_8_21_14_0_10_43_10 TaxID=1974567 RepID=A0A2H0V1I4_9BACT|nr:MAG: hypothetical protein COT99_03665 [Candidatus Falkowbacteria bacterium CG10_big_fil_rev_8_21_14_0_10_43_10]
MINKFKRQFKQDGEVYLRIKARPNSMRTEIKDILADETIKIDVAAPPVKGRANAELVKFLAKEFGVDKNGVKIISGAEERVKLIKINI